MKVSIIKNHFLIKSIFADKNRVRKTSEAKQFRPFSRLPRPLLFGSSPHFIRSPTSNCLNEVKILFSPSLPLRPLANPTRRALAFRFRSLSFHSSIVLPPTASSFAFRSPKRVFADKEGKLLSRAYSVYIFYLRYYDQFSHDDDRKKKFFGSKPPPSGRTKSSPWVD
jgi:hypothetical protein